MLKRVLWWGLVSSLLVIASKAWTETTPQMARMDPDGVQRITQVGGNYYFEPEHIVVRAGIPVELTARRVYGLTPHSLVIRSAEMGLDIEVSLDTEGTLIRFTPRLPGRVEFYCDERLLFFRSHREQGMVGVLEVVE
ncbi:quinol oxidase [Halomonas campisalis]|uniref:Quinol oxidase n=1 Tax=Billgrantia campisalis TaxID=74661 RepID=A0ABS9P8B9_9GAMM|nr:cupredoxin domain-containing protein [Halomonas campisalis]MCG6658017.1 quinol oxidase [Halomonas campisalis]MDR5864851.1 cupredoxin domain-containing protein [Halomonas campisalis]